MTSLTFHLARALGRAWGPGDEIVAVNLQPTKTFKQVSKAIRASPNTSKT